MTAFYLNDINEKLNNVSSELLYSDNLKLAEYFLDNFENSFVVKDFIEFLTNEYDVQNNQEDILNFFEENPSELEAFIDSIEDTDEYYQISEDFAVMNNFVYPLNTKPYEEDIEKVNDKCGNIVILKNEEGEQYYLGLTGAGMDFSEEIGLAYFLLQNYIPPEYRVNPFYLNDESKKEYLNGIIESAKKDTNTAKYNILDAQRELERLEQEEKFENTKKHSHSQTLS